MAGFTKPAKPKQELLAEPQVVQAGDIAPGQVKGIGAVEVATVPVGVLCAPAVSVAVVRFGRRGSR